MPSSCLHCILLLLLLLSYRLSNFLLCALSKESAFLIDGFCQTPISTQWWGLGEGCVCLCMRVCMCVRVLYVCVFESILVCSGSSSKPLPGMLARPPKEARICRKSHNYNQSVRQSHFWDRPEFPPSLLSSRGAHQFRSFSLTLCTPCSRTAEEGILWASINNHSTCKCAQNAKKTAGSIMFICCSGLFAP